MSGLTTVKIALAAIGIFVWAYGTRANDDVVRWIGIAFLVAAFLLRFLQRRRPPAA